MEACRHEVGCSGTTWSALRLSWLGAPGKKQSGCGEAGTPHPDMRPEEGTDFAEERLPMLDPKRICREPLLVINLIGLLVSIAAHDELLLLKRAFRDPLRRHSGGGEEVRAAEDAGKSRPLALKMLFDEPLLRSINEDAASPEGCKMSIFLSALVSICWTSNKCVCLCVLHKKERGRKSFS